MTPTKQPVIRAFRRQVSPKVHGVPISAVDPMLLKHPLFVAIALAIASAAPAVHAQAFGTEARITASGDAYDAATTRRDDGIRAARMALDASLPEDARHRHALAAEELLSGATAAGDPTASWYLGSVYVSGLQTSPGFERGVTLIRSAANNGQAAAAFWMAQHPSSPAHANDRERIRYLDLAAYAGHVSAMNLLSAHYAHRALDAGDAVERRNAKTLRAFWRSKESEHAGSLRPVVGRPEIDRFEPATPTAEAPTRVIEPIAEPVAPTRAKLDPAPVEASETALPHDASDAHAPRWLTEQERTACDHYGAGLQLPGVAQEQSGRCEPESEAEEHHSDRLSATDMNLLGLQHYARGDYGDAAAWFHRSARAGLPAGMTNFALLLIYGRGIDQDTRRAIKLLHKAEALDNAVAALNLGQLHARGAFVERNDELALQYFRRAESLGSDAARSARIQLMRRTGLQ